MKKRLISMILIASLCLGAAGCKDSSDGESEKVTAGNSETAAGIVTTESEETTAGIVTTESEETAAGIVTTESEEVTGSGETTATADDAQDTQTTASTEDPLQARKADFQAALNGISVKIDKDKIQETGKVNGRDYSLTIDLSKWDGYTTIDQMIVLSELFWEGYPRMYERFGELSEAPVNITLNIENEGYEVAEAGGDSVHLHDTFLYKFPQDYDCITHELAHLFQNNVEDYDYLEYTDYIENFADCCRYEYAMKDGYYNDSEWELGTVGDQDTRESSNRFLVWLDYFYTNEEKDILKDFLRVCLEGKYYFDEWDEAWQEIFKGTDLQGMNIEDVWEMYASSDFAAYSSYAEPGEKSDLLTFYDIREKLK